MMFFGVAILVLSILFFGGIYAIAYYMDYKNNPEYIGGTISEIAITVLKYAFTIGLSYLSYKYFLAKLLV
jgi:hypothetical protein